MKVISVDSAARASSWEGAEEGDTLPMLGLVLGLMPDGGGIDRGLAFDVLFRTESKALIGDTSISSGGDSREEVAIDCGRWFDVAESGEFSELISGTVWRRRKELVGANGGSRAILEAGKEGLGPQLDMGEKKGEPGLL